VDSARENTNTFLAEYMRAKTALNSPLPPFNIELIDELLHE
jgi:hypothetical protein